MRNNTIKLLLPFMWLMLSALSVAVDYLTGPAYNFPLLVAIPIVFSTWYSGKRWGISIGIVITFGEIFITTLWAPGISNTTIIAFITARLLVLFSFIIFVDMIVKQRSEIRMLSGLLPICSFCKRIRDDNGNWIVLEKYIHDHSEAEFSHSLCPDCAEKHYGKFINQ